MQYTRPGEKAQEHGVVCKDVGIGPDQTNKQRQAEIRLATVVDKKNREEFTEQDRAKN
jgi:hypothetical protein